jgi:Reverse gyrase
MKEKGIGRPSTYAITIEKLIQRRYVIDKKGYLIPTRLGIEVLSLIKKNKKVSPFVSEDYTKELESKMDEVEAGLRDYNAEIGEIFRNLELEKLGELTYTTIEE